MTTKHAIDIDKFNQAVIFADKHIATYHADTIAMHLSAKKLCKVKVRDGVLTLTSYTGNMKHIVNN